MKVKTMRKLIEGLPDEADIYAYTYPLQDENANCGYSHESGFQHFNTIEVVKVSKTTWVQQKHHERMVKEENDE